MKKTKEQVEEDREAKRDARIFKEMIIRYAHAIVQEDPQNQPS